MARRPLRRRPDRQALLGIYRLLRDRFGHAGWWPGESALEVCLGAVLTQNTAWTNVEKALAALQSRGLLSFEALRRLSPAQIAPLIRSSGTYNVKARRIAALLAFLDRFGGRPEALGRGDPEAVRAALLQVHGVGPETADSILLYAAGVPVFVVDAYTRRIFSRLGFLRGGEGYGEVQRLFMDHLPADAALFNDYHAQIVRLGKEVCRPRPLCPQCPLRRTCPRRGL